MGGMDMRYQYATVRGKRIFYRECDSIRMVFVI